MIFAFPGHIDQIVEGSKTQTRRNSDKYGVGRTYAIQLGRTKRGDSRGRILITRKWCEHRTGSRISDKDAKAEGKHQLGYYTSFEYEELYREMNPTWDLRWCYEFEFWETESIERLKQALKDAKNNPSVPLSTIKSQQIRIHGGKVEDIEDPKLKAIFSKGLRTDSK